LYVERNQEEIEASRSEKCVKGDYLQIFGLIHLSLLRELNMHKRNYLQIFGSKKRFKYMKDKVYPPKTVKLHSKENGWCFGICDI
jgi:hypothetical protein